jgi:5-formyltetrahydrofolate cyclo-ligase
VVWAVTISGPDPNALRTTKKRLRSEVRQAILALDPAERARQESRLIQDVTSLPGLADASAVLLYVPAFPEEIGLRPLLDHVLSAGQVLVLPRYERATRSLTLRAVKDLDRDLEPVAGLFEPLASLPTFDPQRIDWALVPGLAFDRRGFRLGRGAGCYDKLLPLLRPDVPRVALALESQIVDELPSEPHDQPVTAILTPHGLIRPAPSATLPS